MDASIDDYDVGQLIGRGGFASVYRAVHRRSGEEVALKVSDKARIEQLHMADRVSNEIRIHSTLPRHDNVVRATKFFEDEESTYLVMELCTQGNLYRKLRARGKFSEAEAKIIIKQLLLAIQHLHNVGVVHRDLKLSNILMAGGQDSIKVKLCDFGLAARIEHPDEEHYTLCGTPNYIAPEIASNQAHGYPADLWSLGCLFYTLVVGSPPFEPKHEDQMEGKGTGMPISGNNDPRASRSQHTRKTFDKIITGHYEVPEGVELSLAGRALLETLLNQDPIQRTSAREVLQSPYFLEEEEERDVSTCSAQGEIPEADVVEGSRKEEEDEDERSRVTPALSVAFLQGQVGHMYAHEREEEHDYENIENAAPAPAIIPLIRPRPSEEPSMASLPSQVRATRLKQRQVMPDSLLEEGKGERCEHTDKRDSSEEDINLSQRRTRDLGKLFTNTNRALQSQSRLQSLSKPEECKLQREEEVEAGLRVSSSWPAKCEP